MCWSPAPNIYLEEEDNSSRTIVKSPDDFELSNKTGPILVTDDWEQTAIVIVWHCYYTYTIFILFICYTYI